MKRITFPIISFIGLLLFTGCKKEEEKQEQPTSYLINVAQTKSLDKISREFVGITEAEQTSNLAFLVGGRLTKIYVAKGENVKKGQLIAEIDDTDIRLEVDAARSQFETAQATLERSKRLLAKEAISQEDYEMMQTQFILNKSRYEGAQNKLSYTKLYAPFAGTIEKKMADDYQSIQPGEGVVKLVEPSDLLIWFTIPDNNLEGIWGTPVFYVEFDAYKGNLFRAKLKEFVNTSPDGVGIPVSLRIDDPKFDNKQLYVKPGFAVRVTMEVGRKDIATGQIAIPYTAIAKDPSSSDIYVWIVEENRVRKQKVVLAGPNNKATAIISEGLTSGQTVAISGITQLVEGATVRILQQ